MFNLIKKLIQIIIYISVAIVQETQFELLPLSIDVNLTVPLFAGTIMAITSTVVI